MATKKPKTNRFLTAPEMGVTKEREAELRRADWDAFKADETSIAAICDHVVGGESLADFAKRRGFPYVTVLDWINADPKRAENYARAREDRADLVFDQLDEVSQQAVTAETAVEVAGLRLKADNIKWKLARMAPKKYGDRVQTEHSGELTVRTLADEVAALNQRAAK